MEYKLESNIISFNNYLDNMILKYSISQDSFIKYFITSKELFIKELLYLAINCDKYEGTLLEDVADKSKEIYYYYVHYRNEYLLNKEHNTINAVFTLRNPQDLIIFEIFLDKMLKLLELSPKHFINIFPKCPVIFWDKIDDLRETSFKTERDSEEYTRCLRKCKTLSFAFSDLTGMNKIEIDE